LILLAAPGGLAACSGVQSALDPAGPHAAAIHRLGAIMFWGGAAIFALVLVLIACALIAPARVRPWLGRPATVAWGGIAFPVVVLSGLLVYGLVLEGAPPASADAPLRIRVVGEMWWWRVAYLDESGEAVAVSANEVHVPTGRPVELMLTTADVIHSVWIPTLAGKLDMIPGRENRLLLEAERPGEYRGQCAEFCGRQHALMAFDVVAHEPADYEQWLARESAPAGSPEAEDARHGQDVFIAFGCGGCHAIRGTEAAGTIGPDLTHVGSRRMLAAGTLDNDVGALSAWIHDSQAIKPGNRMPPFKVIEAADLGALAAYLESLK
jgi:cytochrome c oxidase subunit 2